MEVVGSNHFLRHLRKLPYFELNMGMSSKNPITKEYFKLDDFILKYKMDYNREIMKFGKIGKIFFYEDLRLENNEFYVFNNTDIYQINYTDQEILEDTENYILSVLRNIDEIEKEDIKTKENEEKKIQKNINHEYWVATDDKNRGKKFLIDQTLDKDSYAKELMKLVYHK